MRCPLGTGGVIVVRYGWRHCRRNLLLAVGQTERYSPLWRGKDDSVEQKMQSKEMILFSQGFFNPILF